MPTGNEPPVPAEPPADPGQRKRAPGQRDHSTDARNGKGRFIGTITADEKAANAARMRANNPGMTYRQIAEAAGYSNQGDCWRAIEKCRKAVLQMAGAELVASQAAQLDDMFVSAMEVLERDHVVVSHGKVVTMVDPETREEKPVLDDGPKLAALREMRQINESYRKLLGADQPTQVAVSGSVKYEVVGVDPAELA
jgi:hypothetical protein